MRIKLFEGFDANDYYEVITWSEYDEYFQSNEKLIDISESDIKKVKDIIGPYWDTGIERKGFGVNPTRKCLRALLRETPNNNMTKIKKSLIITSVEDDYFLVRYIEDEYFIKTIYCKCDQFEGLIKFLKDEDII
jgi:hypothetical protein